MSVPYFDLTNMTDAQREALLKREARRPVVYKTDDGKDIPSEDIRQSERPRLTKPWPHKYYDDELQTINWASERAKQVVLRELGRPPVSDDEYLEVLTNVANEKGWRVTF